MHTQEFLLWAKGDLQDKATIKRADGAGSNNTIGVPIE